MSSITPFNISTTPSVSAKSLFLRPQETSATFAADILRRTGFQQETFPQGSIPAPQQATNSLAHRAQDLEKSLASAINYMADKYGATAGSAMMGIIYKSIGNEQVTEDNLGNALLQVARFVDANFGIEEGDAFLEQLNGDVNAGLNAFFDNGKQEVFFAADSPPLHTPSEGVPSALAQTGTEDADAGLDAVTAMLESLKLPRNKKHLLEPQGTYTTQATPHALPKGALYDQLI